MATKSRGDDSGLDLHQLADEFPWDAERVTTLAKGLLKRGADVEVVHAETYIRRSTLFQWASRMRRREARKDAP